jgi:hypothetical protein
MEILAGAMDFVAFLASTRPCVFRMLVAVLAVSIGGWLIFLVTP